MIDIKLITYNVRGLNTPEQRHGVKGVRKEFCREKINK